MNKFCTQNNNRLSGACSRTATFLALLTLLSNTAIAQVESRQEVEEGEKIKLWQELAWALPAAPDHKSLLSFTVIPSTAQSFHIDPTTLTVGTDGVVRYTLVAQSSAGASSISYEGIRCQSFEKKLYAFGRADGSWSRARWDEWRPIFKSAVNRQHVALAQDYFCRDGQVAGKASEIIDRIRNRRPIPVAVY